MEALLSAGLHIDMARLLRWGVLGKASAAADAEATTGEAAAAGAAAADVGAGAAGASGAKLSAAAAGGGYAKTSAVGGTVEREEVNEADGPFQEAGRAMTAACGAREGNEAVKGRRRGGRGRMSRVAL